ncbi:MAG: phosphotransferase [Acidimicrobiia bacterium]|nr:phosphotransferase [Acidimicrobiia bacterium]
MNSVVFPCQDGVVVHHLPQDPDVPALQVLLGESAVEVLSAAGDAAGFDVEEATVSQVRYVPGRHVAVQYNTKLIDSSGRQSAPMLVAMSGIEVPDKTPVVSSGDISIAVWRFPRDPFLPGLVEAVDPTAVVELLTRLGAPTRDVRLRTRAYRATRRAVVEARSEAGTIYMKVLRPNRVAALQARHTALVGHVPIPHSLGWSRRLGIVAMQALGGRTLRQAIEAGEHELPSPQALVALLDQFPNSGPEASVVKGAYQRSREHARLIGTVLAESKELLDEIVLAVAAASLNEPAVAVHGDFHSSQVLIDAGRIVGLVDVDTAGIGQRTDDLANLVGQLATLTLVSGQPHAINAYIAELLRHFDRITDPAALRLRIAAVVLGLATGPFRVQSPHWPEETLRRLELVQQWIADSQK